MADFPKVRDQFIDVPGGQVFVRGWSTPEGRDEPPVLFLHDSLGCVELWRDFPEAVCKTTKRTVVAYDRLGFGRSTARAELPSQNFVKEEAEIYIPAVLAKLGFKKAELFGYSVGGCMALFCAAEKPELCGSVISESAQAFMEQRTIQGILKTQSDFKNPDRMARLKKYHGDKAEWVLRAWTDTWLSPAFASWSLAPVLPRVHCPVLAIHGDQDEYGSVKFPEMIAGLAGGPSQMKIFTGCDHMPHRERREEVLALVQHFYEKP